MDSHPGKRGDGEVKRARARAALLVCMHADIQSTRSLVMDRVSSSFYGVQFDAFLGVFLSCMCTR